MKTFRVQFRYNDWSEDRKEGTAVAPTILGALQVAQTKLAGRSGEVLSIEIEHDSNVAVQK